MPTALRIGPYRFFFYSADRAEPPHVHVERDADVAKFWLDPVRLSSSGGFRDGEISRIQKLVEEHSEELLRSWDEFFDD
jgi:hypothetical protein